MEKKYFLKAVLLGLIYFIAGKGGLALAFVHSSASPVWPPTAIAIASLLILGYRFWPVIFLGAFFVNFTTAGNVATSIGVATGNTLEGLFSAYLMHRFTNGSKTFYRAQDIFKFVGLVAFVATMMSATIGVTSLALGGYADWHQYGAIWFTWWLGDAAGAIVVTPLLVLGYNKPIVKWKESELLEMVLLFFFVAFCGVLVFNGFFLTQNYPLTFLVIPPLIWAGFRFSQREVAVATLLISVIAIWGTLGGFGPFARKSPNESLLLLQSFMGISTIATLVFSCVVMDAKETEEILAKTGARLSGIYNSSKDAIGYATLDGLLVDVNNAFLTLTGYTKEELLSVKKFQDITPAEYHQIKEILQTEEAQEYQKEFIKKDGSRVPVELTIFVVKGPHGTPVGLAAIIKDISERKKNETEKKCSEEELKKANEELKRLNQTKSEFTSMVSHELRTPLSCIKESISLVLDGVDGPVTEAQQETLGIAKNNVDRLTRLIDNVLNFSRLEVGKMEFVFEKTDLNKVMSEVYDLMKLIVEKKGLSFTLQLPKEIVFAVCDSDKIKEVLINLIDNSAKFTQAPGAIVVWLTQERDKVVMIVEDTGIGIKSEDQKKLFQMFGQVYNKGTRKTGGFGIGLALCQQVIKQHQGSIQVESAQEKGSRFYVVFPVQRNSRTTDKSSSGSKGLATKPTAPASRT